MIKQTDSLKSLKKRLIPDLKGWLLLMMLVVSGCVYDPNPNGKGSYKGSFYEVKQGDTVYLISYITDRDVNDIIAFNHLQAPYTIYPGQKLNLWRATYVAPKFDQSPSYSPTETVDLPTTKVPVKNTSNPIADGGSSAYVVNTSTTQEHDQNTQNNQESAEVDRQVEVVSQDMNQKVTSWKWPTEGRIVRKFVLGDQGNKGIDITGSRGQPVVATAAGEIVYAGDALRGYGNLLIIKHNDEYLSAYAHNDSLTVAEGDRVTAGQKIATLGSTGSDDVRLHFEIRYKGKPVNPENYLP